MLANVFQTAKLNFLNNLSGGGSAVRSKATAGTTEIKQKNERGNQHGTETTKNNLRCKRCFQRARQKETHPESF